MWFRASPFLLPPAEALVHETDALLLLEDGRIRDVGPAARLLPTLPPGLPVERFRGLMLPGFIDCHVHHAQLGIVGAGGHALLPWLERYTFPEEMRVADPEVAADVATRFLGELARQGTTTAAVFGTVHPEATDILFRAAEVSGLRIIAGKSLMDCRAPPGLCEDTLDGLEATRRLIARWHGRGRLGYALTPRFVATSSAAQLEGVRALRREFPDLWLQSHLAENTDEVAWIRQLHPDRADYTDVLEHAGLLGPRTILGHGIHLGEREWQRLHATGTAIAHCPTSNLFLGSGLFDVAAATRADRPVRVGLATDVGAGTSLSLLRTMSTAGQVAQLRGQPITASQALWLATGGGAAALDLSATSGNLAPGLDADVVVVDPGRIPLLAWITGRAEDPERWLGAVQTLGDDRIVEAVFAGGRRLV